MQATKKWVPLVGMAFALGACASVPPPTEQMAVSHAAVGKAESAGAYELAPVEFGAAQEKLRAARIAMEREEFVTAEQLAEAAEVDADLAYYRARSAQAQRAARELQESIETLRRELQAGS